MGSTFDYVPIALTKAFRDAQADENFQGWLKMQEAAVEIVFPIEDVPEIRGSEFTKDGLRIVEANLLESYGSVREAFDGDDNVHRTMRFVYYVGETSRLAFEGRWVSIPTHDDDGNVKGTQPGIQVPFRENFITPLQQLRLALIRRIGSLTERVYGYAERDYNEWIEKGRPPVEYIGTLREED